MKNSPNSVTQKTRWRAAVPMLAGVAALALGACALEQKPSPSLGATGTDVINHPDRHIGEQVTIRGTVNSVYSRGSFTVGPDGFLKTDLRVLARGPGSSVPRLRTGDRVRVQGVVKVFLRRDFLAGYPTGFYGAGPGFYGYGPAYSLTPGFYGLGGPGLGYPSYYTTWEERPVIIAHQVELLR